MRTNSRLKWNEKCFQVFMAFLKSHPELRLGQALFLLNGTNDYFDEEPEVTFRRLSLALKEISNSKHLDDQSF